MNASFRTVHSPFVQLQKNKLNRLYYLKYFFVRHFATQTKQTFYLLEGQNSIALCAKTIVNSFVLLRLNLKGK